MIINKRIKRELKVNFFRYSALFLMMVLGMSLVVGTAAGVDSTMYTVKQSNEKHNIEDGEFSVFVPLSTSNKSELEKKGVHLEETFYMDFDLEDNSTLRIFQNRKDINKIVIKTGELAKKSNEIVLEQHYARKHSYKINDTIKIGGRNYIVTGICTVPDYNFISENAYDVASNTEKFSISFVNENEYKALRDGRKAKSSEEYVYSYILKGKVTHEELKKYLKDMDFDKSKITNKYMKEIIDDIEKNKKALKDGTNKLVDGSKKTAHGSSDLKNGINKLNDGVSDLKNGAKSLDSGIDKLSKGIMNTKDGAKRLRNGASSLASGSNKLKDGLGTLTDKNEVLMKGADEIFNGLISQANVLLSNTTKGAVTINRTNYVTVLDSILASSPEAIVKESIKKIKVQLVNYQSFYDGLKKYTHGVYNAHNGSVALAEGSTTLNEGIKNMESGVNALSKGSVGLKNGMDELYHGTENLQSGSLELSKGASDLNNGNQALYEGVMGAQKDITKAIDKHMNYHYENLTYLLKADDNARINNYEDDVKINKTTAMFAGFIFMILFAYIISVFLIHNIERESAIIGALYSMGYLKHELLCHFLILPTVVVSLGGVVGTCIGFAIIPIMANDSASYFSFIDVVSIYPPYLIIYGVLLPIIITIIVNITILRKKLSQEPLKLLRKEKKQHMVNHIDLGNMSFINKYRIREQLREIRGNITLFAGMFLAILLMTFAFSMHGSITHLVKHTTDDVKFKYMYMLKFPPKEIPKGGTACYTKSLETYFDLIDADMKVSLQGIDKNNPYYDFNVECDKNEIYISDSAALKFNYKVGDKITLRDGVEDKNYTFTVKKIVNYSNGLYFFADINHMRELFSKPKDYYNTLLSDSELNIDNERVLTAVTDKELVEGVSLFMDNMRDTILMLLVVSVIIFILVMYLLIKMMIDKATFSISLIKMFGFNDREVRKLYLGSSFYTVVFSTIVSIPLSKFMIDKAYPHMVSNVSVGMGAYLSPYSYGLITCIIFVSYVVVSVLLSRHLKKVSFVEILKNRE
ncbi:FtsX-like permease family protein [Hathewaya histolytica]|uniref:FtsX-like permease family protein n=1 Tax=Hathewaya histolytica TaxID=1498 RepID=UPI003B67C564